MPLVSLAVAVLFLWLGYQLRFKGRYAFIAGYSATRTRDPLAVAQMLGIVILTAGVAFGICGACSLLWPNAAPWTSIFAAIPLGTLLAVAIGSIGVSERVR